MQATNAEIDQILLTAITAQDCNHPTLRGELIKAGIEFNYPRHVSETIVWLASEAANRSCQRLRKAGKITHSKRLWCKV